jgi:hypothetical protein
MTLTLVRTVARMGMNTNIIINVCKILGFHGGDCEEFRLLGCYAV